MAVHGDANRFGSPADSQRRLHCLRFGSEYRLGMAADTQLPVLPLTIVPSGPSQAERARLVRRAQRSPGSASAGTSSRRPSPSAAGVVAGSVALVGFGADSLIEAAAGVVVLWLMGGARSSSASAERRAQQLIAASFVVLAAYIGVESRPRPASAAIIPTPAGSASASPS